MTHLSPCKCLAYMGLFLLGIGCSSAPSSSPPISEASIREVVATLAHDSLRGREAGTPAGLASAHWIAQKMESIGLKPWKSSRYLQSFPLANNKEGHNVVGLIEGKGSLQEEYLIFSAHYDHLGIQQPVNGDSIANGADDNATGVATMLVLSQAFLEWREKQVASRSMLFIAFDAEELGLQGSASWAANTFPSKLRPAQVIAALNFEMLGKYPEGAKGQAFLTGPEESELLGLLQGNIQKGGFSLIADPYPSMGLYGRSDNASLVPLGIVAHTISTDPITQDPFYHTVGDELETLDLSHTALIANGVLEAMKPIAAGQPVP